jgi:SAM-dependent methyltransferase
MRKPAVSGVFLTALVSLVLVIPARAQDGPLYTNRLAPNVPSPVKVVDRMLEVSNLKPGETLYDLGCGDGRILIAAAGKYKAKAVGVEISPKLVAAATANIAKEGLSGMAHVIHADVLSVDLSQADVVTVYLATSLNEKLKPRFEKFLKSGARVVSHDYSIPGWKPSRVDRTGDSKHEHLIYLYEMPAAKN